MVSIGLKNSVRLGRTAGLLQLGDLDGGAQLDLIEHGFELRVVGGGAFVATKV